VPAIAYSKTTTPIYLSIHCKEFLLQRKRYGRSHLYSIVVEDAPPEDREFKVLLKEIQQHPLDYHVLHIDLYRVDMTRPIRVKVPIELTGKPIGLMEGGLLTQILRDTEIQCLPDAIPTSLVGDVTQLAVGHSLHLSQLQLPAGIKLTAQGDEAVALVASPEGGASPAEEAAAANAAAPAGKGAGKAAPKDKK
jgi:large subunit ribosomal protein L25